MPIQFMGSRCEDGHKFCAGRTVEEVEGMVGAHPAEASAGDLQLLNSHFDKRQR